MSPRPAGTPPTTDGERWAHDALHTLRAARWAPRAVLAFLTASRRRAREVRRARPDLARQARLWELAGGGAWLALCARDRRCAASGLLWWGAVAGMLDWHLGMVEGERGEPARLNGADALTLARAWLVPLVAAGSGPMPLLLAGVTDVLDGRVARATRTTRAGRDLEGLVDACVVAAALRAGRRSGTLGPAPAALERARQAAGAAYALRSYFGGLAPPDGRVTLAARATAPVRFAGLVLAAAGRRRPADLLLTAGALAGLLALARVEGSRARNEGSDPSTMQSQL